MFFVFCTTNTPLILILFPLLQEIPFIGTVFGFQIATGIISAIKIHAVSRLKGAKGAPGSGEIGFHSILVGAVVIAAPYIFPLIKFLLPYWILKY